MVSHGRFPKNGGSSSHIESGARFWCGFCIQLGRCICPAFGAFIAGAGRVAQRSERSKIGRPGSSACDEPVGA